MNGLLQRLFAPAVSAASDAAAQQAAAEWEQIKPQVYAVSAVVAFMAITVYLFYFLPRFVAFWKRAS